MATSVVLAVTLVPDPAAMAAPVEPEPVTSGLQLGPDAETGGELVADDEVGAVVQSRATGRRVEVLSLRSMTSRTWVEPDGSWTTEEAAGPVRFIDDAGVWRDIDLDLERAEDGSVAPAAHPLGLVLPAGEGDTPPGLERVSELVGGRGRGRGVPMQALSPVRELTGEKVGLGWPGALPEPELDGPLATYEDVTPGVDLQVLATSVGYETFVVIDERPVPGEALSWTLPLDVDGAEPVQREDGSIEFVSTGTVADGTPAGEVVSVIPAAHAWDAQVDEAADVPTNVSPVAMALTDGEAGPQLTITPDADWLQDASTVFPVTVDPTYASSTLTANSDTYVQSDTGSSVHGGKTELRLGTYNGGTAVARSYVGIPASTVSGRQVQSARLELYATHSYSCSARNWEAWSAGSFSETTTVWSNKPAFSAKYGTASATKGYSSSCADGWVSVPITQMVQNWSSNPAATKVIGLKAENEADSYGWKKFASRETGSTAPRVIYSYNRTPAVPGAPSVTGIVKYTPPGSTTAGNYTADRTPTLSTAGTDADGNTVKYEIQVHTSTTGSNLASYCGTGYVASGSSASCTMGTLADNAVYYARARSFDQLGLVSGWSGWWGFTVTSTAPPAPTITCPNGYTDGAWLTAVPTADVECQITAVNAGAATPGWIHHRVDGADPSTVVKITPPPSGQTSSITVKLPKTPGQHTIRARTESRSGVQSAATDFVIGWGATVAMTSPRPLADAASASDGVVVTTDRVAVSASGPPGTSVGGGAPTAKLQWRPAGAGDSSGESSTGWTDATGATLSVTSTGSGYTAIGAVSTTAMSVDASGVALSARVPVRLELRVCLVYGASTVNCAESPGIVQRVPHAFGSGYPVAEAGPGQVALWTGEWSTSATDISVPGYTGDLSISRTHATYADGGSSADAVTGVFGPGWTANFDGSDAGVAGYDLVDNTTVDGTLVLFAEDDTPLVWAPPSGSRRTGTTLTTGSWVPAEDDTLASGAVLKVTTAGSTTTKAVVTVTLEDGTVTTFDTTAVMSSAVMQFSPVSVAEPGIASATSFTRDSAGRVTVIQAPVPPGVTCTGAPSTWGATHAGCRALTVTYATSTTATTTAPGDVVGQVKQVNAVLWDPAKAGGAGMVTVPVATYRYDSAKRLVSVTDPRINLTTGYSYDGTSTRLAGLTPAGLTPFAVAYAAASESGTGGAEKKFARITRVRPAGDATGGTATLANVVYAAPVAGSAASAAGLPDMGTFTQAWGQAKTPTYAAAVFGPDAPAAALSTTSGALLTPAQWRYASLQYTDAEGYTVNSASFGAGDWQLNATDYDAKGNVVRTLDERATAAVRAAVAEDPQAVTNLALANQLATQTFYDAEGILVTDTLGPARDAVLPDGSRAETREWTHTDYDIGAPATTPAGTNPATGKPWRLATHVTSVAVGADVSTLADLAAIAQPAQVRTLSDDRVLSRSITEYGTSLAQWTLGLPVATTTDLDASGTLTTGDIRTQTSYDAEGKVTATSQPGATPGPTSTDPGTTLSYYYTAATQTGNGAACGARPEWAGLTCLTRPAGQPPGGLPGMPDTRTSSYNLWLQPTSEVETSSSNTTGTGSGTSAVTRTTTTRYDAAGRVTGSHTSTSGPLPGNQASTGTTTTYAPATGLVLSTTETAPGTYTSTGRTTSSEYDGWGRQTGYTADDGLTTTTSYDAAGRVATVTVPVGGGAAGVSSNHVTTYSYDGVDSLGREERRGLTTAIAVTGLAVQTGAYDEAGQIVHEKLPGRIERTRTYDTAGEALQVVYSGPTTVRDPDSGALTAGELAPWFAWAQANDVEGRVRAEWTPDGIGFDAPTGAAGELPVTGQAAGFARVYTYDRAERLVRVADWARPGPSVEAITDPSLASFDATDLVCTVRAYGFDDRGRRMSLTSTTGPTQTTAEGNVVGSCPAGGTPADATRSATYDSADRPVSGSSTVSTAAGGDGVAVIGSYVYDAFGRQLSIPAVDTPAYAGGDATAGPILIGYDAADTARTLSQDVTVRTGTTAEGAPVTARVREATELSLDGTGRRQSETITSTPLDGTGTPTGPAELISSLVRHYGDGSDNPAWSFTDTPARDGRPAVVERSVSTEGIGGYTATVTSTITGALTGVSVNVANLHGDVTTTIPLDPVTTAPGTTGAGLGPAATSISSWRHTDEYGNPVITAGSGGAHVPKTVGERPGAATTSGPGYGWLGTHERALTTTGLTLMGVRLYNPVIGSFTSTDPIPGGNTTTYAYPQDPINQTDLDGKHKKKRFWQRKSWRSGAWSAFKVGLGAAAFVCAVCAGALIAISLIETGRAARGGNWGKAAYELSGAVPVGRAFWGIAKAHRAYAQGLSSLRASAPRGARADLGRRMNRHINAANRWGAKQRYGRIYDAGHYGGTTLWEFRRLPDLRRR